MASSSPEGGLPNSFRVATFNVNGIRAARRRGIDAWLADTPLDLLCLQEVRAPDTILREGFADGWHVAHHESTIEGAKGRAGVAIVSRVEPVAVRTTLMGEHWDGHGRWVEADFVTAGGDPLTIASVYVHSGEVDTPKQDAKYAFLKDVRARLTELAEAPGHALVVGDINIGHTELDIKNWKGNIKRAGFLPQERAHLDSWVRDVGFVDVVRARRGEIPGPYSWWSWRGKAWDNDAGWRIDYHWATPALADAATADHTHRDASYDTRVSDHSAVEVAYTL